MHLAVRMLAGFPCEVKTFPTRMFARTAVIRSRGKPRRGSRWSSDKERRRLTLASRGLSARGRAYDSVWLYVRTYNHRLAF